jgi:anionic cell wall polymer biosynthesis LytR-Cps2A-Psr (LCP) family protein
VRGPFRLPLWGKFLSGSLLIAGLVGVATAAGLAIDSNDADSSWTEPSPKPERPPRPGAPQTILLIGSEPRTPNGSRFGGEAKLVMLVRLDSTRSQVRLLSLPPSLTGHLGGFGTVTLAQSHAAHGAKPVLELVKDSTGLEVNHLVDLDTDGFVKIVNGLGCVYVDVDRPYQLGKATANAPNGQLLAGYHRLCGATALQYALFAGDGSESLQEARQRELLQAMVPQGGVWHDRKKLVGLFTKYAQSDITDVRTMLKVLGLLMDLHRAPVESVPFAPGGTGSPGNGRAIRQFLGLREESAPTEPSAPRHVRLRHIRLEPSVGRSLDQVSGLPKLYPRAMPKGWGLAGPHVYELDGTGDGSPSSEERASYRWTFPGPVQGDYAGFQATAWRNPPMLNNPSAEMTKGHRTYKLFYDGGRLRTVAWQTSAGSFWVSNSLTESLSNRQMIALANGMTKAGVKPD